MTTKEISLVSDEKKRGDLLQNLLLGNKASLIVIVLAIVLTFASPYFLTVENILNVIRQVCVITIISVGLTVIIATGDIDLSLGFMMGLLGIILGKLMKADIPFGYAIGIVMLLGAVFGFINAGVITIFKVIPFIATIATGLVFQGANYLISRLTSITDFPDAFNNIGQGYFLKIPIPVYIMLFLVLIVHLFMSNTKYGLYSIAVGGNPEAARRSGINITNVRFMVFIIGGICAALSAVVMSARAASAQVTAGSTIIMDAIPAVVIGGSSLFGGRATIWGALFGCLVVGVVNNGLLLLGVNANWQIIAKGLLILIAVVLDNWTTRIYAKKSHQL